MYSRFVSHRYWRVRQVLRSCQSQVLEVSPGTQVLSVTNIRRFRHVLKFCQSQVLEVSPGTQVLSVTGTGGFARYSKFVSHRYWRSFQSLDPCQGTCWPWPL